MSKIGKTPISIPSGASVELTDGEVRLKGSRGELSVTMPAGIVVERQESTLVVKRINDAQPTRALHGLVRSLIKNQLQGVTEGFAKTLEINGVGFRAELKGDQIVLHVGLSHPVNLDIISGVEVKQEKNQLIISGIDKQRVGHMAAIIREVKKPEPYKGKGIKYTTEVIKRKAGKAVKTAA